MQCIIANLLSLLTVHHMHEYIDVALFMPVIRRRYYMKRDNIGKLFFLKHASLLPYS